MVSDGERYGLIFSRIPDKISYARAIGDNPERLEEIATIAPVIFKEMFHYLALRKLSMEVELEMVGNFNYYA